VGGPVAILIPASPLGAFLSNVVGVRTETRYIRKMAETTAPEKTPGGGRAGKSPRNLRRVRDGNPTRRAPGRLNLIRAGATVLAVLGVIALLYFGLRLHHPLLGAFLAFAWSVVHLLVRAYPPAPTSRQRIVVFLLSLSSTAWRVHLRDGGRVRRDLPSS